jgi:hypothetical protein
LDIIHVFVDGRRVAFAEAGVVVDTVVGSRSELSVHVGHCLIEE